MMKNVMMMVCVLVLVGCGADQGNPQYDQGIQGDIGTGEDLGADAQATVDGGEADSGERDLGSTDEDLGILEDMGIVEMDMGTVDDAGFDLGTDLGTEDAGALVDLGTDLGIPDLGTDAGPPDLGVVFCTTAADCNDHNPCTVDTCVPYLADFMCSHTTYDGDGDGYPPIACGGTDCDDTNAAIHPGATEVCDGIDSNCNGVADSIDMASNIEVCNGIDDNCDGTIDEGNPGGGGECVALLVVFPQTLCRGHDYCLAGSVQCVIDEPRICFVRL